MTDNKEHEPLADKECEPQSREMLMKMRQGFLLQVDALERHLKIFPTTSDIRKEYRARKQEAK